METMGSLRRTNYCGDVSMSNVGQEMTVCGSIARDATKAVLFLPTCAIQPVFCSLFLMRIRRKTFLLKQKA